jgi:hypothetical protein
MADPPSHPDRSDDQFPNVGGSPRRYRRPVVVAWTVGGVAVATMIVLHLAGIAPH